jgi:hypothetical protein
VGGQSSRLGVGKEAAQRRSARRAVVAASASAVEPKNILMMGGTRFIGLFLARELVKAGHQVLHRCALLLSPHIRYPNLSFLTCRRFVWQVTLFTRGKAPVTQQLPGESDEEFADYSSKVSAALSVFETS